MTDVPSYPGIVVDEPVLTGRHGAIPARRYLPAEPLGIGLVWWHGGAFIGGDLDMPEADWVGRVLASRGIAVLSLDYRKALDGVTFPVPADDALDGWLWAAAHSDALGVGLDSLHLGGASAGGNLAASVTLRCAEGEGPLPASAVLVYPVLHEVLPPLDPAVDEVMIERGIMRFTPDLCDQINLNYVGDAALVTHRHAFPANGDVSGFPPTYVLDSEFDSLRPSGEAFAEQLRASGVPVRVELEPGSAHGHLNDPHAPEGPRSIDRIVDWLTVRHRA